MKLTLESLPAHLEKAPLGVYLVAGDEPLLVGEAADALRAHARAAGFSERETHFIERVSDWDAVLATVNNLSLFAARRILEVRLASAKPGVAGGAALVRLAQLADPDILVLVIAPRLERDAQSAVWVKAIEAHGALLPIWSVDAQHLVAWLKGRARQLGVKADEEALGVLAERTEGNLLAAQQELEKLRLLYAGAAVGAQAVLASVGDSARFDVGQLGEAALAGDGARALHVLAGLRAEGVEPVLVLWAISKAVRDLWREREAAVGGAAPRTWQRQAAALAKGLQRARDLPFARMIARAERADRMIKGRMQGDAWDEMALLAAEFCTRPLLPVLRTVSNRYQ